MLGAVGHGYEHTHTTREESLHAVRPGVGSPIPFQEVESIVVHVRHPGCGYNHAILKLLCKKCECGHTHDIGREVFMKTMVDWTPTEFCV